VKGREGKLREGPGRITPRVQDLKGEGEDGSQEHFRKRKGGSRSWTRGNYCAYYSRVVSRKDALRVELQSSSEVRGEGAKNKD